MNSAVFFLLWFVASFALSRFKTAKIQLFPLANQGRHILINELNPTEWIGLVPVLDGGESIV
jgi:hypothetical protein